MSTPRPGNGLGVEQKPEGEDDAIQRIVEVERKLLQLRIDHEQLPRAAHPVPRGQHPKHHGCVRARFVIADNVPEALRCGVFAEPGKTFAAWIRFSNARVLDDRQGGGHGMAIKLMGVPGAKLLEGEEHEETQDFVLLDTPNFFIKNALEFAEFNDAHLQAETGGSLLAGLGQVKYFVTHPREGLILHRIEQNRPDNPLEAVYWSTTPYKLGVGAVKYLTRPRPAGPPIKAPYPSDNQLREAMSLNLDPGKGRDATFDFCVQVQVDPDETPIEDPTHEWDERTAPPITVATIHIERQSFERDAQMAFCQNLSYTPWHSLPEHRPLGGINRTRKTVYEAISSRRHELNQVPREEPTPESPVFP